MATRLEAVQEVLETCEEVISEGSYLAMRGMERSLQGRNKRTDTKLKRTYVVLNVHGIPVFVSSNENIALKLGNETGGKVVSCLQVPSNKIADEIINASRASEEFSYLDNPQF